ncbi:MAG: hypothetical protein K2M79_07250 [Muribaculaceae bacterium]|nr:hypothetical protein [Muribaculaceae bacterium]
MKVAVITPIYRNPLGMAATLGSVLTQTYQDILHIIVTPDDVNVPQDVVVLKRKPKGVYDAINQGIKCALAQGAELIQVLNGGDVYATPDTIKWVVNTLQEHEEADFLYAHVHIGRRDYRASADLRSMLRRGIAPPHPSLFIRSAVMKSIGNYDVQYALAADFDLFMRLQESGVNGVYRDVTVVLMEPGGVSARFLNRLINNNLEKYRIMKQHGITTPSLRLAMRYMFLIPQWFRYKKRF